MRSNGSGARHLVAGLAMLVGVGCGGGGRTKPAEPERRTSAVTQLPVSGWVASASVTGGGGDVAANAIDGSASTRWTAGTEQANGQWFQIDMRPDMQSVQPFNELTLDAGSSTGGYPAAYAVTVSNDGATWGSAIATGTGGAQLVSIKFLTQTARYVRVTQTGTKATPWSIHELGVWLGTQPCDTLTCTASDQCHVAGTCNPSTGTCSNPNAANNTTCNDGNACTQVDKCQAGVCTGTSPVACPALNSCHYAGVCNTTTGACVNTPMPTYTACNDGNPCSTRDACMNGVCTGIVQKQCAAKDQCHVVGTCDVATGQCSDPVGNEGAVCNDGNACTAASSCQAGVCTGTSQVAPCTQPTDTCQVATCDPAATVAYPTDGLAALWKLDDHRDSTENAAHWLLDGYSVLPTKVVPGKVGGALEFDGSKNLGGVPTWPTEVADAPGFTFFAWVKPSFTCPGTYGLFHRDFQFGIKLYCTASGTPGVQVGMNTGAGPFNSVTYSPPMGVVPLGEWSHVAMAWSKQQGKLRVYVNAVEVGNLDKAGDLPPGGGYMDLGWNWYSTGFIGSIDEAALYRRALDQPTLAALLVEPNACKTAPKCADPANPCQAATCSAGVCGLPANKPDDSQCDDGNPCTDGDKCVAGTCNTGSSPHACSASAACDEAMCDPKWKAFAPPDVISQWHLDGNLEDPTSGHNLSGAATAQVVPGKFGQAMHFDGAVTSCASRPSLPGEAFANPAGVTLAAWVKPDANFCTATSGPRVIAGRLGEVALSLGCFGGAPVIQPQLNGQYNNTSASVPSGQWSHIVVTYNPATGNLDGYLNGARVGRQPFAPNTLVGTASRSALLQVGCGAASAVDEVIILRRAVGPAEVANMAGSPTLCNLHPKTCFATDTCHTTGTCDPGTGVCSNPVKTAGATCSDDSACTTGDTCNATGQCVPGQAATVSCAAPPGQCLKAGVCKADEVPQPPALGRVGWWRFEGDARDSGGQGLDLVRNGGAIGAGRIGRALEFDGNSCMHLSHATSPLQMSGATGISMMAWVKTSPTSTCPAGGQQTIMGKGADFSLRTWCYSGSTPGLTHAFRAGTGAVDSPPPPTGSLPPNAWTLVAVTWNGDKIRRYLNGAFVGPERTFAGTPANTDPSFDIGCVTATQSQIFSSFYNGSIDEATLYNRALTDAEISTYFAAASAHSCQYDNKDNGVACVGDGNACTKESCQAGLCASDGLVTCTAQDLCHTAGTCAPVTGCSNPPIPCNASDGCHSAGVCDPVTGACSNPSRPEGSCQVGPDGAWLYEPTVGMDCSQSTGINRSGQIVGYSDVVAAPTWPSTQVAHPFMTVGDAVQSLSTTAVPSAFGAGISSSGHVITNGTNAQTGARQAHLHRPNTLAAAEPLPFPAAGGKVTAASTAFDMAAAPTVIGAAASGLGANLWQWAKYEVQDGPVGEIEILPQPTSEYQGEGAALGINAEGAIVGYYTLAGGGRTALIRDPIVGFQNLYDLIAAPDGSWDLQVATAINSSRKIVGFGQYESSRRPFVLDYYDGSVTNIGALPGYEHLPHNPTAINASGVVVGTVGEAADQFGQNLDIQRAFLYSDRTGLRDLNDLAFLGTEWVFASAVGINDTGDVTGTAINLTTLKRRAYKVNILTAIGAASNAPIVHVSSNWIATASSSQGSDVPDNAIDGSKATRWNSGQPQGSNQWFQLDMLEPTTFSRVTIDSSGSPTDYPRAVELFASNDPENWGAPIASDVASAPIVSVTFAPKTAQYLRIVQKGSAAASWSIHDVRVALVPTIIPSVEGVATIGGRTMAIFSYDNVAGKNLNVPYGSDNTLDDPFALVQSAAGNLPTWFLPGKRRAVFAAEMGPGGRAWTVAGITAYATVFDQPLNVSVDDDGTKVSIAGRDELLLPNQENAVSEAIVSPNSIAGVTAGTIDGQLDVSPDGAATYHVPIWTPNAPVRPELSLDYNSRNGASYLGVGFTLGGLSAITRCKTGYVQEKEHERHSINLNSSDHLCLDGKLLILVKGSEWTSDAEYRPEGDPFTRVIEHNEAASGAETVSGTATAVKTFDVQRRDGTIETYGGSADAYLVGLGADPALGRVAWALTKESDRSNNVVRYTYDTTARGGMALIPSSIKYGSAGPTGEESYSVEFSVGLIPKPESMFVAGYELPLTHRLTGITISGPAPIAKAVVKAYRVAYNEAPSISSRFVVSSLKECDGTEESATCKPPTEFGWEPGVLRFDESDEIIFDEVRPIGLSSGPVPYYALVPTDIDGDGRDDILYRGVAQACPGATGGAAFDPGPGPCRWVQLYYRLAAEGFTSRHVVLGTDLSTEAQLMYFTEPAPVLRNFLAADLDGDGKSEIIQRGITPPSTGQRWPAPFVKAVGDINGDGAPDLINPTLHQLMTDFQLVHETWIPIAGATEVYINQAPYNPAFQLSTLIGSLANYRTLDYSPRQWPNPGGSFAEIIDLNGDGSVDILADGGKGLVGMIPLVKSTVTVTTPEGRPTAYTNLTGLLPTGTDRVTMSTAAECFSSISESCWKTRAATHLPLDINGDGLMDVMEFLSLSNDDAELAKTSYYHPNDPTFVADWVTPDPKVHLNQGAVIKTVLRDSDPQVGHQLQMPYAFKRVASPPGNSPLSHFHYLSWAMRITPEQANRWYTLAPVPASGIDVMSDPGVRVADLNGDGRDDLVSFASLNSRNVLRNDPGGHGYFWLNATMLLSNGSGFAAPVAIPTALVPNPMLSDSQTRVRPSVNPPGVSVQPWGLAFTNEVPANRAARGDLAYNERRGAYAMSKMLDVDGDGLTDFIAPVRNLPDQRPVFRIFRHAGKQPDLLISVKNGLGAQDEVTYKPISDPTVYTPAPDGTCRFPVKCVKSGLSVVSRLARDNGVSEQSRTFFDYKYTDGRADQQGGGWLGFGSVSVVNGATLAETKTDFNGFVPLTHTSGDGTTRRTYPRVFRPSMESTTYPLAGNRSLVHRTISLDEPEVVVFNDGGGQPVSIGGMRSAVQTVEELETNSAGALTVTSRRKKWWTEYDQFGNAQRVDETVEEGAENGALTTVDRLEATFTFDNLGEPWLLGQKRTEVVEATGANQVVAVRKMAFTYKSGTNLVETVTRDPDGDESTYLKTTLTRGEGHGLVTEVTETDRNGRVRSETIAYDKVVGLFPLAVTRGALTTTAVHHATLGVVIRQTDPNGVGVSYSYDTFGRRRNVTPDVGGKRTYTFAQQPSGIYVAVDTDGGPSRSAVLDRLGREKVQRVRALDGTMTSAFLGYDAAGRLSRKSRPIQSSASTPPSELTDYAYVHYGHDAANRPTSLILPGTKGVPEMPTTPAIPEAPGGATTWDYFWRTTTVSQFDKDSDRNPQDPVPPKIKRSISVDGAGRPAKTTFFKANGIETSETSFSYGPFGLSTTITDAYLNVTSVVVDPWGRRRFLTDPDVGTQETVYDGFDQPIRELNARGTDVLEYDEIGRLKASVGPDGAMFVVWDAGPNALGKPAAALSADDVASRWEYDGLGRPRSETTSVEGVSFSMGREYDAKGRLGAVNYPGVLGSGVRATYGYSSTGYLNSVSSTDPSLSWTLAEQKPDGQLAKELFGNGIESVRDYGDNGFLRGLVTRRQQNPNDELQRSSYAFDGLGRLEQRGNDGFEYDAFSRLKEWTHGSTGGEWKESYEYDDLGNLTQRKRISPNENVYVDESFRHGERGMGPHALTSGPDGAIYDYDELGNQNAAPGRTLAFKTFGLPRTMTKSGVTTTFKYDFMNRRVLKRSTAGSTTVSVGEVFELRIDDGVATATMSVIGGRRTAIAQILVESTGQKTVRYIHDDHLGSPQIVTSESGTVDATLTFDPWGNRIGFAANGQPVAATSPLGGFRVGYTGHNHDDELGLVDMKGRLYDPAQRRFISPDPLVQDALNGQSYNRYAYVMNDPMGAIDPSGWQSVSSSSPSGPGVCATKNTAPHEVAQIGGKHGWICPTPTTGPKGGGSPDPSHKGRSDSGNRAGQEAPISRGPEAPRSAGRQPPPAPTPPLPGTQNAIGPARGQVPDGENSGDLSQMVQGGLQAFAGSVPGAHFSNLAVNAWNEGRIGLSAAYAGASLLDAAMLFAGGMGTLRNGIGEGTRLVGSKAMGFADGLAAAHFEKHGESLRLALGRIEYTLENYLDDANHVIRNGTFVSEMNGFVRLVGGLGSAKAAFVGVSKQMDRITTFGLRSIKEIAAKAPSLGWLP